MTNCGNSRIIAIAAILGVLISTPGCDGATDKFARQAVYGTVTVDGQPLAKGSISFDPDVKPDQKEVVSGGAVITNGSYSIDKAEGLTPGKYRVSIMSLPEDPPLAPGQAPGAPTKPSKPAIPIPDQYNAKTTLSIEVTAGGKNSFPFDLKTK